MSIEIGKLYGISSKTAKPGENKYFIEATNWNSKILEHLQQNSNPPDPENSAFGDWILTDNPDTSTLKELPKTLKEQFGIVNIHNPNGGGYSRKRNIKKRSATRRRRSSKRKTRKMNKRRKH
jgi:hypothetical protein